ncbi:MAG: hypothetical protein K0R44_8 [Thermomicrobiales bacterium]|nr:hypothetical protein [Thermomicrobiales bacterium]MDF3014783.1 hypothetical protein [Thermomicrobiales bacterium]
MTERRQKYTIGPGPWCGTSGGYGNHHCRCDACRAANAAMAKDWRDRNAERSRAVKARWRRKMGMAERPPVVRNPDCPLGYGSRTGYTRHGCRCDLCREGNNRYHRERRRK